MAKKNKGKKSDGGSSIAVNKKATHEYFIEERFEAGIALQGWEVKSLREKKLNITESYVFIKNNEAFLSGANIAPLISASTHVKPEPTRVRKLLLHRQQIDRLYGAVERKGYTLVALNMHWSRGKAKLEIGLAKGKKLHDKRASDKDRTWQRDKQRILKRG